MSHDDDNDVDNNDDVNDYERIISPSYIHILLTYHIITTSTTIEVHIIYWNEQVMCLVLNLKNLCSDILIILPHLFQYIYIYIY